MFTLQWRIQDFPEGDANPKGEGGSRGGGANLLFGQNSPKNYVDPPLPKVTNTKSKGNRHIKLNNRYLL